MSKNNINSKLKEEIEKLSLKILLQKKLSKTQKILAKQLLQIFDSISDAIALIDEEGFVVQCNKAMEKLAGKKSVDIVGSKCWEIIHRECKRNEECYFIKMKEKKKRVEGTVEIKNKKYKLILDPFLDEKNEIRGAVHIFSKI